MHTNELQQHLSRRPFEPFVLTLDCGQRHEIHHPDRAFLMPTELIVGDPQTNKVGFYCLSKIESVEPLSTPVDSEN